MRIVWKMQEETGFLGANLLGMGLFFIYSIMDRHTFVLSFMSVH